MRKTDIVSRVDNLGRIVIPLEIRRTQHIQENDLIEIFISDGGIFLKRYSSLSCVQALVTVLKEDVTDSDLKWRSELEEKIAELEAILKREKDNSTEEMG